MSYCPTPNLELQYHQKISQQHHKSLHQHQEGYISIPRRRILKDFEINGAQRITAWVESMRASLPTHLKSTPSFAEDQNSWILRHPSTFDMFDQIIDTSKGKQIVMFLDYDGTLSPIVDDPDHAFMSDSMRKIVRKLARRYPTAIVTDRCQEKGKKAEAVLYQPASEFLPMMHELDDFNASYIHNILRSINLKL